MAKPAPSAPRRGKTRAESEIHELLDMFPAPVLISRDGLVARANDKAAACFAAATAQKLIGRPVASLIQRNGVISPRMPCVLHRLDGTHRAAELSQTGDDADNAIFLLHETSAGETGRFAHLAEAVLTATDEAILITDDRQTILKVNPAFERVTGYRADEAIGHTPRLLSSGRHDKQFYTEMWTKLLQDGHWHGEIWNRRKSGEIYVQRITLSVLRDEKGHPTHYVAVFNDITSSKREADRFRHMANHDSLTLLPNRILLQDRTEQALAQAARGGGQAALLFLDLDGFKEINDQLGHLMGDHVLEAVAARLCRCVRESDTVARLGGDEFVILLPSVKSARDAEKLSDKLLKVLSEPMVFGEIETRVGVSVGIALYPRDGIKCETLLAAADAAMYRAKRLGGGRVVLAG